MREPTGQRRRRALGVGGQTPRGAPSIWLALAAGWSGGNSSENESLRIPPPPQGAAQAVRDAALLAVAGLPPQAPRPSSLDGL